MENDMLNIFGLNLTSLIIVSTYVFFIIEWIKIKFPSILIGGYKTQIIALVISFGFAFKLFYPNWETLIIGSLAIWLLPETLHQKLKG